jgi:elongation factor 1-gamma
VNHLDKKAAIEEMWKTFDPQGFSFWKIYYIKYEGEGVKIHLTNNLKRGFLERLGDFRKYTFGPFGVYGDEPNLEIRGLWIWRGVDIPLEVKEHPSYEYYTFTKVDHASEEGKKLIEEYWCGIKEDESVVEGLTARRVEYYK